MDIPPPVTKKPRIVQVQEVRRVYPKLVMHAHLQHPTTLKDQEDRKFFEEGQKIIADVEVATVIEILTGKNTRPKNLNELRRMLYSLAESVVTVGK